jgi:UPF0042 nucleotide-binding protein
MDQEKNIVASDASSSEGRDRTRVVLVTGLSGAGRSSALRAFEDMGYEAVDNLPLALLPSLLGLADDNPEHDPAHAVAVGIDTRTRAFRPDRFHDGVASLRERPDLLVSVVYLDCASEVLARRFTETRRRHPMAVDRPVVDGILRERGAMASVRAQADHHLVIVRFSPRPATGCRSGVRCALFAEPALCAGAETLDRARRRGSGVY